MHHPFSLTGKKEQNEQTDCSSGWEMSEIDPNEFESLESRIEPSFGDEHHERNEEDIGTFETIPSSDHR